jgi:hypothetical protein
MDDVEDFIQEEPSENGSVFSNTDAVPREKAVLGDRQGMPRVSDQSIRPLRRAVTSDDPTVSRAVILNEDMQVDEEDLVPVSARGHGGVRAGGGDGNYAGGGGDSARRRGDDDHDVVSNGLGREDSVNGSAHAGPVRRTGAFEPVREESGRGVSGTPAMPASGMSVAGDSPRDEQQQQQPEQPQPQQQPQQQHSHVQPHQEQQQFQQQGQQHFQQQGHQQVQPGQQQVQPGQQQPFPNSQGQFNNSNRNANFPPQAAAPMPPATRESQGSDNGFVPRAPAAHSGNDLAPHAPPGSAAPPARPPTVPHIQGAPPPGDHLRPVTLPDSFVHSTLRHSERIGRGKMSSLLAARISPTGLGYHNVGIDPLTAEPAFIECESSGMILFLLFVY